MPTGSSKVVQIYEILAQMKAEGFDKFRTDTSEAIEGATRLQKALRFVGADSLKQFELSSAAIRGMAADLRSVGAAITGGLGSDAQQTAAYVNLLAAEFEKIPDSARLSGTAIEEANLNAQISLSNLINGLANASERIEQLGRSASGAFSDSFARSLAEAATNTDTTTSKLSNMEAVFQSLRPAAEGAAVAFQSLVGTGAEELARTAVSAATLDANLLNLTSQLQNVRGSTVDVGGTLTAMREAVAAFGGVIAGNEDKIKAYAEGWNLTRASVLGVRAALESTQALLRQQAADTRGPKIIANLVREMTLSLKEQEVAARAVNSALRDNNATSKTAAKIGREAVESIRSQERANAELADRLKDVTAQRLEEARAAENRKAEQAAKEYVDAQTQKLITTRTVTAAVLEQAKSMNVLGNNSINLRNLTQQLTKEAQVQRLDMDQLNRVIRERIRLEQELIKIPGRQQGSMVSNIGQIFLLDQMAKRLLRSITAAGDAFGEFEKGLAQVRKTANATTDAAARLGENILRIGQATPILASDLTNIAGILGQVGAISFNPATQSVEEFSEAATEAIRLVGEITLATDLNAEEAAKSYGRLKAIFRTDIGRIRGELTALTGTAATTTDALRTIVGAFNEIANSTTATVAEINEFIRAFGGVATNVGITAEQVAGLSGTIADLGVMQRVAGTALSRLFADMGKKAEVFADVLGVTVEEFQTRLDLDAFQTLVDFLTKMNEASKERREVILAGLGAEQRFRNTILKLSEGVDLLERNVRTTNNTLQNFRSIGDEAAKFAETFNAQLTRLKNGAIAVSNAFEPFFRLVGAIASALGGALTAVANFVRSVPIIGTIVPIIAGVGIVVAGVATAFAAFRQSLALLTRQAAASMNLLTTIRDLFRDNLAGLIPGIGSVARASQDMAEVVVQSTNTAAGGYMNLGNAANEATLRMERGLETAVKSKKMTAMQANVIKNLVLRQREAAAAANQHTVALGANSTALATTAGHVSRLTIALKGLAIASSAAFGIGSAFAAFSSFQSGDIVGGITSAIFSISLLIPLLSKLSGASLSAAFAAAKLKLAAIALSTAIAIATAPAWALVAAAAAVVAGVAALAYYIWDTTDAMDENAKMAKKMYQASVVEAFRQTAVAAGVAEAQIEEAMEAINSGAVTAADALAKLRKAMENTAEGSDIQFRIFADVTTLRDQLEESVRYFAERLTAEDLGVALTGSRAEDAKSLALAKQKLILDEIARISAAIVATAEAGSDEQQKLRREVAELGNNFAEILYKAENLNVITGWTGDRISDMQLATIRVATATDLVTKSLQRQASLRRQIAELTAAQTPKEQTLEELVEEANAGRVKTLKDLSGLQDKLNKALSEQGDKLKKALADQTADTEKKKQNVKALDQSIAATERLIEAAKRAGNVEREEELNEKLREQVEIRALLTNEIDKAPQILEDIRNRYRLAGEAGVDAANAVREAQEKLKEELKASVDERLRENYAEGLTTLTEMRRRALEDQLELEEDFSKRVELLHMDLASDLDELNKKNIVNYEQRLEAQRLLQERYVNEVRKLHLQMLDEIEKANEESSKRIQDQLKEQENFRKGLERERSALRPEEDKSLVAQIRDQERIVERLKQQIEREGEAATKALEASRKALAGTAGFAAVTEAGATVRKTLDEIGIAAGASGAEFRDTARRINKALAESRNATQVWYLNAKTGLYIYEGLGVETKRQIALEEELAQARAANLATFRQVMSATEQSAKAAGRAAGALIESQRDLQAHLMETANTAKGRFAQSFLEAFRKIAADRTMDQFRKGMLMEQAIAQFRQQFAAMDGDGPEMDKVLAVAEQLAQSEDGRLKTARDLRKEAEAQKTALLDQFDLSKKDRREAEKLLQQRARLQERVGQAREGTSVAAVRTRQLAGVEGRLEEILGPGLLALSKSMTDTSDSAGNLLTEQEKLDRLNEARTKAIAGLNAQIAASSSETYRLNTELERMKALSEGARESLKGAGSISEIQSRWAEIMQTNAEAVNTVKALGHTQMDALKETVDAIQRRTQEINLSGSITNLLKNLVSPDQAAEWKVVQEEGTRLNEAITTNMRTLSASHKRTTEELHQILRDRKISEQMPVPNP